MRSEKHFILMQKIKCISRVGYMSFIHEFKPDPPSSILAWLFEKSIDLVDGIIQLHKANLDECSQALIRVLLETYLKYIHFVNLMTSTTPEGAAQFAIDSIVLMKEKHTNEQDKVFSGSAFTDGLGELNALKEKYQDQHNPFIEELRNLGLLTTKDCLKAIRKHGFMLKSIDKIAEQYNKLHEYQIMYRNFSRNVHSNDLAEYFRKQGHLGEDEDYFEARNVAAFDLVLRIFLQMMDHMNHVFSCGMADELKKMQGEYDNL